jgi:diguanylate cyclase (GGDEF)-like protein/PAS domain S-box-containing protein
MLSQRNLTAQRRSDRRALVTAGSVASLVILLRLTGLLQSWELSSFDLGFRLRPLEPMDDRIVIIGIDEPDLRQVGRWPIPDQVLAQLLTTVQAANPRAIGLDIYRDMPVEPGHAELLQTYGKIPNLVGIEQLRDKASPGIPAPAGLDRDRQVGFNNLVVDLDSKVRRGLLYWTGDGKPRTSFALMLAQLYLQQHGIQPQTASDGRSLQLGQAVFQRFRSNDGGYINADAGGYQFLANLRGGANRFEILSMTAVLHGRVAAARLHNRIVLIGSTATSLKDFFHTSYTTSHSPNPWQPQSPRPIAGVELQANFISQVLSAAQGRALIQVWPDPVEWLWIGLWAWIGASLSWRLRSPHLSAVAILIAGTSLASLSYGAFLAGWWVPLVPPVLALVMAAISIIAYIAHLEGELKRSKEFLSTIINTIPDPIFVQDQHHRWIVLNQAFCRFLGHPIEDLLNKTVYDVFPSSEADAFHAQDQQVFMIGREQENEESFTNRQGRTYLTATKRSLHRDAAGNVFLVGVIRDITERKRLEEELKRTAAELVRSNAELQRSASHLSHLANHDPLTGLPNRKLFLERLNQSIAWASDHDQLVALLFLDLDGFKQINDSLGHDIGDLLLKAVADRLNRILRGSDTLSRLGGDEFTVVLPAIPTAQDAGRVAEKILLTLSQPFKLKHQQISVTTSIGISLYPQDGAEPEVLIKQADIAMYQSKEQGKNQFQFISTRFCDRAAPEASVH